MRVVSLFSGAGGSCLGWHALGVEHALCCEWDPSAGATLAAAGFPWSPTDLSDSEALRATLSPLAGSIDVLEASPPCQAWSSAGARLGARDSRNGWPWTWNACDVVRPRWLVAENVPGLLSHRGECPTRSGGYPEPLDCPGCYWSEVILEEARRRFAWVGFWRLNAADFGVPQHRRRVFLVCGPRPAAAPMPTHGDPASLRQRGLFGPGRLPWVTMREALHLGASAEVIGGGTNPQRAGVERTYRQIADEPSTTVAAEQIGNAGPWVIERSSGARDPRVLHVDQPSPTVIAGSKSGYDRLSLLERPAPSVSASSEVRGSGVGSNPEKMQRASDALYLATGRRRLTVAEVAALQGFPADHPWQGTKTSRYRQVGNAVPPRLAEAVGRAILEADCDR